MNNTQLVSPLSSFRTNHASHDQSMGQSVDKARAWKLRHWIALGYAVPVIALVVSAAVTVANVRQVSQLSEEQRKAWEIGEKVDVVGLNVQSMAGAARGYLLLRNPRSLQEFNQARASYMALVNELDSLMVNEEEHQALAEADALISEFMETQQGFIDLVNRDQSEAAIQAWRDSFGRDLNADIGSLLTTIKDLESDLISEDQALQAAALRRLQVTLMTAAAISVILSILIGALVVRKASQIMGQAAGNIVSSSSEIAASVEQQERTSSQQAASVSETSTTMDELGASSRQSAEQAEAASAGAQQALTLTEGGILAVDRSLEGMTELREKVDAIADQILRLSEQTNQIGSISGLVSDLANQTNMLALNAAVEAVRAGEHGKGFGVVSGEIRKLADQSKRSAEKINALVADIQTAINSTVMVTDEGTKKVEEGVKIAEETANAFAGVADAINNVVLNSQQISLNVKQQAVAIQQVVSAMNSLNTGAQENANGIGQIKAGTHQLNESAIQLKRAI